MGGVTIVFGFLLIKFRERAVKYALREQQKTWGREYDERDERMSQVAAIIIGAFFVLYGILALAGISDFD